MKFSSQSANSQVRGSYSNEFSSNLSIEFFSQGKQLGQYIITRPPIHPVQGLRFQHDSLQSYWNLSYYRPAVVVVFLDMMTCLNHEKEQICRLFANNSEIICASLAEQEEVMGSRDGIRQGDDWIGIDRIKTHFIGWTSFPCDPNRFSSLNDPLSAAGLGG